MAWSVSDELRCEEDILQVALVCKGVQCWARATVLDVAAKVIVVGLAITQCLLVCLATSEETFDEVNKSYMHLVAVVECGVEVEKRMTDRLPVE